VLARQHVVSDELAVALVACATEPARVEERLNWALRGLAA
jgi:hypothetical protein